MTMTKIVESKWPNFDDEQLAAVNEVLRSGKVNYWTGSQCRDFEAEYAEYLGVNHAISVANGTVALELALAAIRVGPGDEVIVPARTFIATASSVVMRGATPIIADVDVNSQNITAETFGDRITPRTKAVICVHLGGQPCEMESIVDLARSRGIKVIEDCAQAHGATYRGRQVGSLGDLAAFSFCQDKIISTGGEGGLLATNQEDLWRDAWSYKDHGKCYDATHSHAKKTGFKWLHKTFGTNWRMTEMQAAIGRIQLRRLTSWIETRRRNAAMLHECCRQIPALRTLTPPHHTLPAYYRYYCFIQPDRLPSSWNRDVVVDRINERGVPCFVGSCGEIYREAAFGSGKPVPRLPGAANLFDTSLAFLVDQTLDEIDMRHTAKAIRDCFRSASSARLAA